jgi:hypothetical protein
MKEFTVTIDRIVSQVRTLTIMAENEEQARTVAMDTGNENEGWEGKEYCVECSIHIEEVPNNYIDKYGNPYDSESDSCWPAGGGLHKDCEFNADALYAYYTLGDRYKIAKYLRSKGFKETLHGDHEEVWVKGNTEVTYEDYDNWGHLWGYMHTELI